MIDRPGEVFCKLADPSGYAPCDCDYTHDDAGRRILVGFFVRQLPMILKAGIEAAVAGGEGLDSASKRADAARADLTSRFTDIADRPEHYGRVDMLCLDRWRDHGLRRHGFGDAFSQQKDRENAKMLPLLPAVCGGIDALPPGRQIAAVIEGVLAGNLYDMGVAAMAERFFDKGPDFAQARRQLSPHPWLLDDSEALARRLLDGRPYHKVVIFLDNAGSDFVLGIVPLARWLAKRGMRVVLAANELPTLNDMSIADLRAWWPRVVEAEPTLAGLPVEFVSSGSGEPLLDLSRVSKELNAAATDADLVVLEGMGRAVESNLQARFTCDAAWIAMIKDEATARRHGGKVFDLVCKFVRGENARGVQDEES